MGTNFHDTKNSYAIKSSDVTGKSATQGQVLLSLSDEIIRIRGKQDMLDIIRYKLKKYIQFDDSFILRYDKEKRTCRPYIYYSKKARSNNPTYKNYLHRDFPVIDDAVNDANYPVVYDVETLLHLGQEQMAFIHRSGINEFVVIKLIEGNQLSGLFVLLSEKRKTFKPEYLDLLHKLSYQISIATANIIANEEIVKSEEEKTILLSLSNEIASLKDRNDLHRIVNTRIKKLFAIKQFGIAQLNEDRITHSAFMMDLGEDIHDHPDFSEVITLKFSIKDAAFHSIMVSDDPVVLNVLQLADEPDAPAYVRFWKAVGFRELLCLALRAGGNNVGCIFFNINANEINNLNTGLLKGVCAQLSVAVSNIIANEKIKRAEEEKSLLLSFSNDIATVRDKEGLRLIIKQYLKNIFHIKEYIITTRNSDGETYSHFLHDSQADDPDDAGWKIMLGNRIPVKGAFIGAVLQAEEAVFVIDEIVTERKFYFPAAAFWQAAGAKKVMGFRLRVADKDVGLLVIQPGQIHTQLLKGISAQLAIAIANIFAIEEIVGREKEKSMLLEFSNAIASVRDKASLSKILNREMKGLLGINEYAIHVLSEDKKTQCPVFYDPEADFAKHPAFLALTNQQTDVNDGIFNTILASDEPITFDAGNWVTLKKPPVYAHAAIDIGLKKLTGVRIHLGEETIAVLNFRHDDATITPAQYPLLKSICSQIAIAIANIIANEKVLHQLVEIDKYKQQLEEEKVYLKEEIETSQNFSELIGESDEMKKIFALVSKVAPSDSTVLILGETGTGKELVARAIHNSSARKNKLMVKVNCAALPASLIESELFGHERGSFTGALERRIGKFELANGGTLFLDEIGEMPLELQAKLLRALQEREIERLGGKTTIKVDVRIIAATNRNLEKLLEEGRFRSDLFYRLNVFPIHLPPLRNRREDILPLAAHFIHRFVKKTGKKISGLGKKATVELVHYSWPGNIRELEHLIERSVLLSEGQVLNDVHLLPEKTSITALAAAEKFIISTIDDNERSLILNTLKYTNGRIAGGGGAAALLGVPPSTLNSKMKRLGIRKEHLDKSGG